MERGHQAGLLLASCCWEAVTSPPQASVSWSVKWSNDETHNNAFRESPKGPGPASFRSPAMHTPRENWALWAVPREGQPQVHKPMHTHADSHAHMCTVHRGDPSTMPTHHLAHQLSGCHSVDSFSSGVAGSVAPLLQPVFSSSKASVYLHTAHSSHRQQAFCQPKESCQDARGLLTGPHGETPAPRT